MRACLSVCLSFCVHVKIRGYLARVILFYHWAPGIEIMAPVFGPTKLSGRHLTYDWLIRDGLCIMKPPSTSLAECLLHAALKYSHRFPVGKCDLGCFQRMKIAAASIWYILGKI